MRLDLLSFAIGMFAGVFLTVVVALLFAADDQDGDDC